MIRRDAVSRVKHRGNGDRTRLVCGFFACDRTLSDLLILPLPRMFKFRVRGDSTAALLPHAICQPEDSPDSIANPGAQAVLCKLSELLFVVALRACAETLAHDGAGWHSGIRNRYVSHALALMHQQPGIDWTLDTLAHELGVSPGEWRRGKHADHP